MTPIGGRLVVLGAGALLLGAGALLGTGGAPATPDGAAIELVKSEERRRAVTPDGDAFELRIERDLDRQFGPRPVGAVDAAQIVTDRFGGDVRRAELDEDGGGPVWRIDVAGGDVSEVDVSALDGRVLLDD